MSKNLDDRLYFRLEFMRRDPRFQRDVANHKALPPDHWLKTYGVPFPGRSLPRATRARFRGRKGVIDWSVAVFTGVAPAVGFVGYSAHSLTPNDAISSDDVRGELSHDPRRKDIRTLTVKVNLLKDRGEIKAAFNDLLDEACQAASVRIKKTSRRLGLYQKYLRAYDLRQKGLTFTRVARIMDPHNADPVRPPRFSPSEFRDLQKAANAARKHHSRSNGTRDAIIAFALLRAGL